MSGSCTGARPRKSSQRRTASLAARENESSEDAYERRLKESQKVEERVEVVFNEAEVTKALEQVMCLLIFPACDCAASPVQTYHKVPSASQHSRQYWQLCDSKSPDLL